MVSEHRWRDFLERGVEVLRRTLELVEGDTRKVAHDQRVRHRLLLTDFLWKPFRDRTFSLSVGYGTRTPDFIRLSLRRSKRAGAKYRFRSLTLGYKSSDRRLILRIEYELRRTSYSTSYDISRLTWLALRACLRKRQGTNISLSLPG